MKAPKSTNVSTAVFFEKPAHDGWPEDAGGWPISGCVLSPVEWPGGQAQVVRRGALRRLIKLLLRRETRTC